MLEEEKCKRALDHYEGILLRKKNVIGIGISDRVVGGEPTGKLAVVVYVSKKLPESAMREQDVIPKELPVPGLEEEFVQTDVVEQGEVVLE